jgi:hypothetical protein
METKRIIHCSGEYWNQKRVVSAAHVYRKPTNVARYLQFKSKSFNSRKETGCSQCEPQNKHCQAQHDFHKEIRNIKRDLLLNEYPASITYSVINESGKKKTLPTIGNLFILLKDFQSSLT